MVELIGHYSNRDGLSQSPSRRKTQQLAPSPVQRRKGAILAAITSALELAGEPMPVHQIHSAVERLLGEPVAYRSIKGTLSDHARGRSQRFVRPRYGWYALSRDH